MSGKFAAITANLLARKGDATPSAMVKTAFDWHAPMPHLAEVRHEPPAADYHAANGHAANGSAHPGNAHSANGYRPHVADGPFGHPAHGEDHPHPRKIQVGLSDEDHERLRIAAARREISRQQAVREALSEYFEKLGADYRGECRCISGATCGRACV